MTKNTIIPCPYCEARVQAKVLAEREYPPSDDDWVQPHKYVFAECSGCNQVLVGYTEWGQVSPEEIGWTSLSRRWPEPEQQLHVNIPRPVRSSLREAKRCFEAKAYMACAVMCGRAIEGICKDKTKAKTLGKGLQQLKDSKVIDSKLFEWGDALRKERNIGAHAGDDSVSAQDANDVLDFAVAISEYVYVLDEKYQDYKSRKSGKVKRRAT